MKQDVVEYMMDSFVDFKGNEHKIIACALSQSPEKSEDGSKLVIGWEEMDGYVCKDDPDYADVYRVVSIGISVCHPTDEFDVEKGKLSAYHRAKDDPKSPTIYTTCKGIAGKALVEAFLKQEINFLKENPERIIKGYNREKERFEKKESLKTEIKNLSTSERMVIGWINEGVDVAKCIKLAKEAKNAGIKINE